MSRSSVQNAVSEMNDNYMIFCCNIGPTGSIMNKHTYDFEGLHLYTWEQKGLSYNQSGLCDKMILTLSLEGQYDQECSKQYQK